MASFWKTMLELGVEKIRQLGGVGAVLGFLWIVMAWVLFDWMTGAWTEGFAQAGNMWGLSLLIWLVIGLAVYLYFDPHGVRSGRGD